MKKPILKMLMAGFLTLYGVALSAQVQFKIQWREDISAYQVSFVSSTTWSSPQNTTSSAQVTIKAPTGSMEVYNVKSLQGDVKWEFNSRYNAPVEAPNFDYFSFGLVTLGTKGLAYKQGQEVPLFTFQNAGDCAGGISLVNNAADAFMPPNSAMANIGNHISTLGSLGNAYKGNVGDGAATCSLVLPTTTAGPVEVKFDIYPTPAEEVVNLGFQWDRAGEEVSLKVFDLAGKLVLSEKQTFRNGSNLLKLDIAKLKPGSYSIQIKGSNFDVAPGKFMKM